MKNKLKQIKPPVSLCFFAMFRLHVFFKGLLKLIVCSYIEYAYQMCNRHCVKDIEHFNLYCFRLLCWFFFSNCPFDWSFKIFFSYSLNDILDNDKSYCNKRRFLIYQKTDFVVAVNRLHYDDITDYINYSIAADLLILVAIVVEMLHCYWIFQIADNSPMNCRIWQTLSFLHHFKYHPLFLPKNYLKKIFNAFLLQKWNIIKNKAKNWKKKN